MEVETDNRIDRWIMLKDRDEIENESLRRKEDRSNQLIQGEVERLKKNTRRKTIRREAISET